MPANLTPQYHKAEEEYRRATSPDEELRALQTMLRELPKHKGTDKLQAELKQKISKAKKDAEVAKSAKKGHSVKIPRQGAGTVVLVGPPNGGKSQLVARLTRAEPEVAPYPFTTREPAPAMMPFEDVMVQLIDTPPITADFFDPYVQALIRQADLALLVVGLAFDDSVEGCAEMLERLNTTKTRLGKESYLDENDMGLSYTRTFTVANMMDAEAAAVRLEMLHELCPLAFPEYQVSATEGTGLEALRAAIYRSLDVVRVYTKLPTAREADYDKPFTLRRGGTVLGVAELVHRDLAESFRFAKIWGTDVHPGTQVKGDHVVCDKDVVELHAS